MTDLVPFSDLLTTDLISNHKRSDDQTNQSKAEAGKPFDFRWLMVQDYLRSSRWTDNTKRSYERELRRFLNWTEMNWQDVNSSHLALYKEYLRSIRPSRKRKKKDTEPASNLSKSSVNVALRALKSFYAWFCKVYSDLIKANPTRGLKLEKIEIPPAQNLTSDEMNQVWQALEELEETQLRDRALVHLLAHGLRAGEAVSLNIGAYDGKVVLLTKTKTKYPRYVPLSQAAREALSAYIETLLNKKATAPLLISYHPSFREHRLTYHGVYAAIEHLQEITGIENLHPHRFRHTFATDLLLKGMDPLHAQNLTGHRTNQSFRRYTLAAEQHSAVDAFYRIYGEQD